MDLLADAGTSKTLTNSSGVLGGLFDEVEKGQIRQNYLQLDCSETGESPLAACLVDDCLVLGKSIDQGGALYNHVLRISLANQHHRCDRRYRPAHFVEKKLNLDEFYEILSKNYEGHEALRQYIIHKCPHFGNNEQEMDEWGAEFYRKLVESCKKEQTLRNGKVIPGAFAFMMHEDMGKACMATPDGRQAGEAFNGGSDPVSGRDIKGPTASLLSTTTWDQRPFLGGIAVNMRLNLSGMNEDKLNALKSLIKTFMARNGFELQVNSISPETLENAMRELRNTRIS
jgi:formate C-acetyltransferase